MVMNFKTTCFLASIFITVNCFSQDKEINDITGITKFSFLSPGISYEKRIEKFQSLHLQAIISVSGAFRFAGPGPLGDNSIGNYSSLSFDPGLDLQYRYYYNAAKRKAKGKRTEMNSLNYLMGMFQTFFSRNALSDSFLVEYKRRPINSFAVAWGLQRNYKSRFSLDLNMGLGFLFAKATRRDYSGRTSTETVFLPAYPLRINLGFWLNKK